MKTTKWLSITLAALLNLGGWTTIPSLAADASAPASARGQLRAHIAEKLNLTDDQKAQIKTILRGEKGTLMSLLGRLHDTRKALRAAIHASDANETSVRAAAARVAAVEGDLAVERMKIYGKIAPILTDEQRRQIADFEQRADNFVDGVIARIGERSGE
jgi:Spy/CpxP family protein refolding chaperone